MPKLIVYVSGSASVPADTLSKAVDTLRWRVAEAASTPNVPLTVDDVDVDLRVYNPQLCRFGQEVAVEIETFDLEDRVKKLNKPAMLRLKMEMMEVFVAAGFELDAEKSLLWLKYVSHQGHHV